MLQWHQSCYDWIVLLVAALCMCHLGTGKPSVLSMVKMIHAMKHHTCTAHGNLTRFTSQTTWGNPIAGIGHSNGMGPAIWVVVSSPLFELMKEDCFLSLVHCAMLQLSQSIGRFAFVDDTDLCASGLDSWRDTVAGMQQSVTTWEGLLCTMGGALVSKKAFGICWTFNGTMGNGTTAQQAKHWLTLQSAMQGGNGNLYQD